MKIPFKIKKHQKILLIVIVVASALIFYANRKSEISFLRNYTISSNFYNGFIEDSISANNYSLFSNDNILLSYTVTNNSDVPLKILRADIPFTASEVYYFLEYKLKSFDYKYEQRGFISFPKDGLDLVPPDRPDEMLLPKERVRLFLLIKNYSYKVDNLTHSSNDFKDITENIKVEYENGTAYPQRIYRKVLKRDWITHKIFKLIISSKFYQVALALFCLYGAWSIFYSTKKIKKRLKKYYKKFKKWKIEKRLIVSVFSVLIPLLFFYFDVYERIFLDQLEFKLSNKVELPIIELNKNLTDSLQTRVILGHFEKPNNHNHKHDNHFYEEKNRIKDSIINARSQVTDTNSANISTGYEILNASSIEPNNVEVPITIFNSDSDTIESPLSKRYASKFFIKNNSKNVLNNLKVRFKNRTTSTTNLIINMRCRNCLSGEIKHSGARPYDKDDIYINNLLPDESLYFDIVSDKFIDNDIVIVFDEVSSELTHISLGAATTSRIDNFLTRLFYNNNIFIDLLIFSLFMFGVIKTIIKIITVFQLIINK